MKTIFNGIAQDKLLHSYISNILFVVLFGFLSLFGLQALWCYIISTIVVVGIGVAKELIDDKEKGNRFDWKDIIADVSGIILGALECTLFIFK